jgi:hypothetical protein
MASSGSRPLLLMLLILLLAGGELRAQAPPLAVVVGAREEGRPVLVQVGDLLDDQALLGALQSGLPLRFHLRVELWRKGVLDRLAGAHDVSVALLQDPLGSGYSLETPSNTRVFDTLLRAQGALAASLRPELRPPASGRYYYLATLEVETLSLSDLDELRRWLRGEVAPAIEGRSPPIRAVERGLRRVMIRVIGLPTRRYEARTAIFDAD